jgi:hypothetical protein
MENEYITPIGKRALLIIDLVQEANATNDWDAIDLILDKIEKLAEELTAW